MSNNDGVCIAVNEFAKDVGVKKFEPYFKQRELIERTGVTVFSSNFTLYGAVSDRIMQTVARLTPAIEIYSIDECFTDLTGISQDALKPLGHQLRDTVWKEQRIPMGVSISPTKTLCKLGQYAAKKIPKINGVAVLTQAHQWEWLAKRVAVAEVWGVGRRLNASLTAMGVESAYDLTQLGKGVARKLGGLPLERTVRELNGEHCIPFEFNPPSKQQIICSRSFGTKLYQLNDVLESVTTFSVRVAEKLRNQESLAGRVSVWLVSGQDQRSRLSAEASVNLPGGSDDSRLIAKEAIAIANQLFKPGCRYLKAGVGLVDIRPREFWQRDMLSSPVSGTKNLMPVMDQINSKYGRHSVKLARQAGAASFSMKQELLSPSYLTRWADLPRIIC